MHWWITLAWLVWSASMNACVYKVLTQPEWDGFQKAGTFQGSPADARDGFIHLSGKDQVEGVIARYFQGQRPLFIVEFSAEKFGKSLRWETSHAGEKFPHLYGRELKVSDVLRSQVRR